MLVSAPKTEPFLCLTCVYDQTRGENPTHVFLGYLLASGDALPTAWRYLLGSVGEGPFFFRNFSSYW